mmetsp:Transcript_41894/g.98208  ORF Transcript_41894/g.98208 Transcript_41894/m.98208 type:complete len:417 (-) Transcript_41894:55-1305(-)
MPHLSQAPRFFGTAQPCPRVSAPQRRFGAEPRSSTPTWSEEQTRSASSSLRPGSLVGHIAISAVLVRLRRCCATSRQHSRAVGKVSRSARHWREGTPVAWAWAAAEPGAPRRRRGPSSAPLYDGLEDIANEYDAFSIDVEEILSQKGCSKEEVQECLQRLHATGKKLVMVSDYAGRAERYRDVLAAIKLPEELLGAVKIVTSGELIHQFLSLQKNRVGEHVMWLAESSEQDAIEDQVGVHELGYLPEANIDKVSFVLCTGGGAVLAGTKYQMESSFSENGEVEAYYKIFRQAVSRGLSLLCVGTQEHMRVGERNRFLPAKLAFPYKQFGGKVVYFGRPYNNFFDEVLRVLDEAGVDVASGRVAHIGVSPERDVAGAKRAGLDTVLVEPAQQPQPRSRKADQQKVHVPTVSVSSFRW